MSQYSFAQYQFDEITRSGLMTKYGIEHPDRFSFHDATEDLRQRFFTEDFMQKLSCADIKAEFLLFCSGTSEGVDERVRKLDRNLNLRRYALSVTSDENTKKATKTQIINTQECCALIVIWLGLYRKWKDFRYFSNGFKCADLLIDSYKKEDKNQDDKQEYKEAWQWVIAGLITEFWSCFEDS